MNNTYKVTGIYLTGEETCGETFTNIDEAKAYYEELIIELQEEYDDVKEVIDYITIFVSDEDGLSISNIETYTYDWYNSKRR